MTYDLPSMVKKTKRARFVVRMRGHTLTQERQLAFIYRRVVAFWRAQIKQLRPVVVMADAGTEAWQVEEQWVQADLFVESLILMLEEWASRSAEWVRLTWVQRVKAETGVDLKLLASSQEGAAEIRAAVEWATALIRDLNESTRNKLVGVLADATAQGLSESETTTIVRGVLQASERRARLIAHDQTQKIVAKLNEMQQKEAGVDEYVWNHSFLPNARRHHVERQGNRYRWDKPPRDGHPGYAINCRCTAAAIVG